MFFLLAQAASAVVIQAAPQNTLFPIDSGERGTQISDTFGALPHATSSTYPEFIFQTLIPPGLSNIYGSYAYIINGRLPFVQNVYTTPNNTLLIISYRPLNAFNNQYIVVPPEQIVDLIYVQYIYNEPPSTAPFTSTAIPNQIPFFSVDQQERIEDIISATNQLLSTTFATGTSQVWIQTTLSGPFVPPFNSNNTPGLLQNVKSIAQLANGLIQITYLPINQATNQTVIVTPQQVVQIFYIPYFNTPWVPR